MNRIVLQSRVGTDGVLHLDVPLGPAEADREVQIVIEATPKSMTQEQWGAWVLSMAGSITDPDFKRHEQGEYEKPEELTGQIDVRGEVE